MANHEDLNDSIIIIEDDSIKSEPETVVIKSDIESNNEEEEENTQKRQIEIVDVVIKDDDCNDNVYNTKSDSQLKGNSVEENIEQISTMESISYQISPAKINRKTRRYRQTNKFESSDEEEKSSKSRRSSNSHEHKRYKTRKRSRDENENVTTNDKKEGDKDKHKHIKQEDKKERHSKYYKLKLYDSYYDKTPPKVPENKDEQQLICSGIFKKENYFDESMCRKIEKKIEEIGQKAECGVYKQKTYDKAPLRNKFFFGEGYTYGQQMAKKGPGQERLHNEGDVDEIPKWIQKHIIKKLYDDKLLPDGFINSAVINEYFPGGCIVSHVDPLHIFDRPIVSISFNSKSFLSFGCRFMFNPIRTTEPVYALPLERGCLTMMGGYAADNITHCIRPCDVTERRCVIILRRVYPKAPRVSDIVDPDRPLHMNSQVSRRSGNLELFTRKRAATMHHEEERHEKRKRHSY